MHGENCRYIIMRKEKEGEEKGESTNCLILFPELREVNSVCVEGRFDEAGNNIFIPRVAGSSVKGSSPVRFFDQKLKDRNRNRSRTVPSVGVMGSRKLRI
jgi:hypothetical protein